jgi:hypothetical protein
MIILPIDIFKIENLVKMDFKVSKLIRFFALLRMTLIKAAAEVISSAAAYLVQDDINKCLFILLLGRINGVDVYSLLVLILPMDNVFRAFNNISGIL